VSLVGKPNVGKSTLLNALLGRKVSIVSPRPQTTRHRILGILTREDVQIVFVDSPGWHRPLHPLGRYLLATTKGIIEEADVLVMMIDATSPFTREDQWVVDEVRRAKHRAIAVINKADAVKKPMVLPLIQRCADLKLFEEIIPISALREDNLDALMTQLIARLPIGPYWFEPDQVTDQTTEQMVPEFIREQILLATRQEIPHAVAVILEELKKEDTLTTIRATIVVERQGQKAIVIGQGGALLKSIGIAARSELERLLDHHVFLQLWVKVMPNWRKEPVVLRELGYEDLTERRR
jgi:GTP-binding protein Era